MDSCFRRNDDLGSKEFFRKLRSDENAADENR
jgi:hypothetical protein